MRAHPEETMKKTLLIILSLCLAAACLTGCGKEKSKFSIGNYKGLKYQAQTIEVTDEEVDKLVNSLEEQYITYKIDEARMETPVKSGDVVNIDYEGILAGETKPFDGGSAKGTHLEIGSGRFIAGFEDGLIGKKPGETVVLNLKFPDQYYENYAGKDVKFTVTINAIEKKIIPTISDEMVSDYTDGLFKTVAEYRDYAKQYIENQKKESYRVSLKEELLGQVVAATTFDKLDEKKLDDYYSNLVNYYTALASNRGVSLETYISAYYGKSSNEFYAELKSIAEKTMKEELVLNEIISKEKIELTDASYSEKITEYMDRYGYTDQAKFEQDYTVEKIRQSMLFDLAIQKIIDYAVAE